MCFKHATLYFKQTKKKVTLKVQEKVSTALIDKLAETLPKKLQEQGILITTVAKSSTEQAEFFFDFVQGIQAGDNP
jgi:hypothetical protein